MKVYTGETCTSNYVLKVKNCRKNTESKEVLPKTCRILSVQRTESKGFVFDVFIFQSRKIVQECKNSILSNSKSVKVKVSKIQKIQLGINDLVHKI